MAKDSRVFVFDHVSIGVADLARAAAFYDACLGALGLVALWRQPRAVGYGPPGYEAEAPFAVVTSRGERFERPREAAHLAFVAPDREAVQRFHAAGLAHGGTDEGPPGIRESYDPGYYAAFLRDPDGHRVEAVVHES